MILVSSANKDTKARVTCDGRLLINIANRGGPRMLSWGTPERIGTIIERDSLICTHYLLE